jgi:ribosomal protein S18 acetylase RimI-like enzyme
MAIYYTDSLDGITTDHLRDGFFEGWPNPPQPAAHLRILQGSYAVVLAVDEPTKHVIGFITAISDGVSAAYIPHLEVLRAYRDEGIGSELVRRMVKRLAHFYMIDLVCDDNVKPFYARLGFRSVGGMVMRNYERQDCD